MGKKNVKLTRSGINLGVNVYVRKNNATIMKYGTHKNVIILFNK